MKRGPTEDEIDLIRRLVGEAGSFKELERWMRVAMPDQHSDGRPPGPKYRDLDARILWVVSTIRFLHLSPCLLPQMPGTERSPFREPPNVPTQYATQYAAIETIVDLCMNDPSSDFAWAITGGQQLGASKNAVISRLMARNPVNDLEKPHFWHDTDYPLYSQSLGALLLDLHWKRLDLQLLPPSWKRPEIIQIY